MACFFKIPMIYLPRYKESGVLTEKVEYHEGTGFLISRPSGQHALITRVAFFYCQEYIAL